MSPRRTPDVRRDCACPKARHTHGTPAAYQSDRCRCRDCKDAVLAAYHRRNRAIVYGRYEQFIRTPHGTVRRLRALAKNGWNKKTLAQLCGISRSQMDRLMLRDVQQVQTRVADAVRAVYDALWDKQPPRDTRAAKRSYAIAIARAQTRGWPGPLAWDDESIDDPNAQPSRGEHDPGDVDEVKVDRAIHGIRVGRLTPTEKTAAINILHARGLSNGEIGRRLGMTADAVFKQRLRNPAEVAA